MDPSLAPRQELQEFSDILQEQLYHSVRNKEAPDLVERYVQLFAVLCLKM